jgi:hypothetical protein
MKFRRNIIISNQYNSDKLFLLGIYVIEVARAGPIGRVNLNMKLEQAPSCTFNMMKLGVCKHTFHQDSEQERHIHHFGCFEEDLRPNLNLCLK